MHLLCQHWDAIIQLKYCMIYRLFPICLWHPRKQENCWQVIAVCFFFSPIYFFFIFERMRVLRLFSYISLKCYIEIDIHAWKLCWDGWFDDWVGWWSVIYTAERVNEILGCKLCSTEKKNRRKKHNLSKIKLRCQVNSHIFILCIGVSPTTHNENRYLLWIR